MSLIIQCDGEDCYNKEGFECDRIYPLSKKASKIIKEFTRENVYHLCPECIEKYNESIEGGELYFAICFDEIIFKVDE
jgi:hypothetical protein